MGLLHDGLDGLSKGAVERLAASLMGEQGDRVSLTVGERKKLGKVRKRGNKTFEWENLEGVGLNQTIKIEVELPGYYVAALMAEGDLNKGLREAVQEWLIKRGKTWWQPRFLVAVRAKQIEAYDRFTRSKGD